MIKAAVHRCMKPFVTEAKLQFKTQSAVSVYAVVRYGICEIWVCCLRLVDDVQRNEMQCKSLVFVLQVCLISRDHLLFYTPVSVNVCWTSFLIMLCVDFDMLMHFIGLQTAWNHKRSRCVPYIWPDVLFTRYNS